MFLCVGRKWLVFSAWIEIHQVFLLGHRDGLDIGVGIEIHMISVTGSKYELVLCVRYRKRLGFIAGLEIGLFFVRGSKHLFFVFGSKLIVFILWIGIDLVFVCGSKMTFFVWGSIYLYFAFLRGWSKLAWFLYAGQKPLGFSASIEIAMVFVWVVEIGSISVKGIELDLISK